jgi:hypothetical protein
MFDNLNANHNKTTVTNEMDPKLKQLHDFFIILTAYCYNNKYHVNRAHNM